MNRRLPIIALLLAWVCANGALLDAAQVLAWAKMFRGYAAVMPAGEALAKTFDPANSCRLCVRVAAARRAARSSGLSPAAAAPAPPRRGGGREGRPAPANRARAGAA
ncbi:MAG: hypothetical protein ACKOUK_04550 [Verrucomicrobiota bacterium]